MAQLDKFIKALHDHGAETLTVRAGQPISLSKGKKVYPLLPQEVSPAQVLGLVQELAPADAAERMTAQQPTEFSYQAPSGPVTVAVEFGPAGPAAVLRNGAAAAPGREAGGVVVSAPAAAPTSAVDTLLHRLVTSGASDLHLRVGIPPIYRRDGELQRDDSKILGPAEIQAMLDSIAPERDRNRHRETGDADFAYEIEGVARFRVNAARDRGGPMAVFRVIPREIPTVKQMGITKEVEALCNLNKGLVVVTGPTGSGKSTTLAALVNKMNVERNDHILTIEDPIEFVHESKRCLVTHRQVGVHTETFKSGLRAALREDPDIVLIGELRDLETVAIAIETAETGHLVFGTLHTTTAASTVDRIIDQFPADRQAQIRIMLSESLRGVISQTLLRKIGGGRVAAREILLTTPAISNLIREGKTYQIPSIIQTNRKLGMTTLNDHLLELIDRKIVEPKEAYMKAVEKTQLLKDMQARGINTGFMDA